MFWKTSTVRDIPDCSRPRPRPELLEAKAKAKARTVRSQGQGQGQFSWRPRPRPRPRPVIMIVEKNDISHQNPIVKLTTKRLSKHKLSTKLSLSLYFSHQQATVTGGYYI